MCGAKGRGLHEPQCAKFEGLREALHNADMSLGEAQELGFWLRDHGEPVPPNLNAYQEFPALPARPSLAALPPTKPTPEGMSLRHGIYAAASVATVLEHAAQDGTKLYFSLLPVDLVSRIDSFRPNWAFDVPLGDGASLALSFDHGHVIAHTSAALVLRATLTRSAPLLCVR